MRALRFLLALAAALLPAPALADVTAHYAIGPSNVTVEAADNGDSSFEIDSQLQLRIIHHDGADYVVTKDAAGTVRVARADLLLAVMFGSAPQQGPYPRFDSAMRGPETLAGYSGTNWSFGPQHNDDPVELLLSPDPRLVPVGNVFRRLVELLIGAGGTGVDSEAFRQIFARGTPLRFRSLETGNGTGDKMLLIELDSVSFAAIDPARFTLPGPVIPAEDFAKLLQSLAPATTGTRIY